MSKFIYCQPTMNITVINLNLLMNHNTKNTQHDPRVFYSASCPAINHPFTCCFDLVLYLIWYHTHSPRSELMISEMLPNLFVIPSMQCQSFHGHYGNYIPEKSSHLFQHDLSLIKLNWPFLINSSFLKLFPY